MARSAPGFLAECFWPGVTEGDLVDLDARAKATVAAIERVRYIGSLLLPADGVVFCLFDGPSVDAVRDAATRAGIPFERILVSVRIGSLR